MKLYDFSKAKKGLFLDEVGEPVRLGLSKMSKGGYEYDVALRWPPSRYRSDSKPGGRETWEWVTHLDVRGPNGLITLDPISYGVDALCCCTDLFERVDGTTVEFWHVVGTEAWVSDQLAVLGLVLC